MLALAFFTASVCDFAAKCAAGGKMPAKNSSLVFAELFTLMLPRYRKLCHRCHRRGGGGAGGQARVWRGGSYPLYPAALGYAVVTVSWPDQIFRYPTPFTHVGLWDTSAASLEDASSHILRTSVVRSTSPRWI